MVNEQPKDTKEQVGPVKEGVERRAQKEMSEPRPSRPSEPKDDDPPPSRFEGPRTR